MNQWFFVYAAYIVGALGTFGLLLVSASGMRQAERANLPAEQ